MNLKNCKIKLEKWLNNFDFVDLNEADKSIDWNKAPVIKL